EIAKAFRPAGAIANGAHDLLRSGDADIGGNQELFERLNRVDVDRAHALFLGIGALHNLIEPVDDLLFCSGQPLAKAIKKSCQPITYNLSPDYPTSARCGRSMRS